MLPTFKQALTEVFIRTLEKFPDLTVAETIAKIEACFTDSDSGHCPDLDINQFKGSMLLYSTHLQTRFVEAERVKAQLYEKDKVFLLEYLIKTHQYDIRETFQLLNTYSQQELHENLSTIQLNYSAIRASMPLPALIKELMIRLLHTYSDLSPQTLARLIQSPVNLENNQLYLSEITISYAQLIIGKLTESTPAEILQLKATVFSNDYLTTIAKLRVLNYDTREIFAVADTVDLKQTAAMPINAEQMYTIENCLYSLMSDEAVYSDCREADDSHFKKHTFGYHKNLTRAMEKVREITHSRKPIYTSFVDASAADFADLLTLQITDQHLLLLPNSRLADILNTADLNKFNADWVDRHPFISPTVMKTILTHGANCSELLDAERKVIANNLRYLTDLTHTDDIVNYLPPATQARVKASLYPQPLVNSTGLLVTSLVVGAAQTSEDFSAGFLLAAASVSFTGLALWRNREKVIKFCGELNLFGMFSAAKSADVYEEIELLEAAMQGLDEDENGLRYQ